MTRCVRCTRCAAALSMAGVDGVALVAGPLYQVVREARDRGARVGPDIIDFVQQGVFALRRTLNAMTEGSDPHEDYAAFEAESQTARRRARSKQGRAHQPF